MSIKVLPKPIHTIRPSIQFNSFYSLSISYWQTSKYNILHVEFTTTQLKQLMKNSNDMGHYFYFIFEKKVAASLLLRYFGLLYRPKACAKN